MLTKENQQKMMGDNPNERVTASTGDIERLRELRILLQGINDPGDAPAIEAEIFQIEQSMRS